MVKSLFPLLSLYLNGWRNVHHIDIHQGAPQGENYYTGKETLRATAKTTCTF